MATGTLYRPVQRDAHGDPVNDAGEVVHVGTEVGTINGIVLGGSASTTNWTPTSARGTVVSTANMVGVPVSEAVQAQHGDTLVLDGVQYKIQGPPQWASRGLVSTPPRYRWWTATAFAN